ncbi:pectinesterase inhibitor-like [Castanea sativa]|uniref:pectinesterase inhibitor-like n=1 Tax=Castanea sativa TaxID=21020 RepID=UPI003F652268
MASPINCVSILVIPLLVTSLFYQVSAVADEAFLRSVCQKTKDFNFCLSTLKADPRTVSGEGIAKISIAIVIDTIQVTVDQIPGLFSGLSDRVERTRMENCQRDFNDGLLTLRNAISAAASKNYAQSTSLIIDTTNKLLACDNSYKTPPVRKSPLADPTTKLLKKCDIAIAAIDTVSG